MVLCMQILTGKFLDAGTILNPNHKFEVDETDYYND
jgi:hypothetical protein